MGKIADRIETLHRRAEFLATRIDDSEADLSFDKHERSALLWVLQLVERVKLLPNGAELLNPKFRRETAINVAAVARDGVSTE